MSYPVNAMPYRAPVYPTYPSYPTAPMSAGPVPTLGADRYTPSYAPSGYSQPAYAPQAYYSPVPQPSYPQPAQSGGMFSSIGMLGGAIASLIAMFRRPQAARPAPSAVVAPPNPYASVPLPTPQQQSDEDFVTGLYQQILGRQPDPQGYQAHLNALRTGMPRVELYRIFVESEEYRARQQAALQPPAPQPDPLPAPSPAPQLPSNALPSTPTVEVRPEYGQIPVDTSSDTAAITSAARWVRENRPELFVNQTRDMCKDVMTLVIGALRAHGFNAFRCVNHPDLPPSNSVRWGSDSLVLNGTVYDCYADMGVTSRPQAAVAGTVDGRILE